MLQLTRIEDPRDNLERASRDELFRFAQDRGVKEIDDRMFMGANAAIMMRKILRQKGMTNIQVRPQQLGMPPGVGESASSPVPSTETISADEMAERDYAAQQAVNPEVPVEKMDIRQLRHECKARGIKMARTDNLKTLREKLMQ